MVEYKLKEVSQQVLRDIQNSTRREFEKAGKQLEPPTYETVLPNGKTQTFIHDKQSISDEKTSEIEKEQWEQYQRDTKELAELVNEKTVAYLFCEGVECEITEEWKNKMQWLGVELPTNEFDLKVKFVNSEIAKTPEDIMTIIMEIMKLSTRGVDQTAIENAEATFRDKVRNAQGSGNRITQATGLGERI